MGRLRHMRDRLELKRNTSCLHPDTCGPRQPNCLVCISAIGHMARELGLGDDYAFAFWETIEDWQREYWRREYIETRTASP